MRVMFGYKGLQIGYFIFNTPGINIEHFKVRKGRRVLVGSGGRAPFRGDVGGLAHQGGGLVLLGGGRPH